MHRADDRYIRDLLVRAEDCLAEAVTCLAESRPTLAAGLHEELELVRAARRNLEGIEVTSGNQNVWAPLRPRERDYAIRVALGMTNSAIALDLHVSRGTVNNVVASVLRKLDLNNRVELATWVFSHPVRRLQAAAACGLRRIRTGRTPVRVRRFYTLNTTPHEWPTSDV